MPTSITSSGITFDDATTLTTGVLPTANIANGAVTPAKLSQPYTLATSVASTSGTAIDFTGIPTWVRRVTVMFNGVSTNGSSLVMIQLGDSGGIETSGYLGSASYGQNGTNFSSGFLLSNAASGGAIYVRHGSLMVTNISGSVWSVFGVTSRSDAADNFTMAGTKELSNTLDRVRITTVNGTDTFDAGTINISYEG